jgi:undecaprenyl-diphosphatase
MPIWFAVVLGIVQGTTEFLPISSTAHLRIVPVLLGRPDPGAAFTAVIQLGTLAAVVAYFARDLGRMTRALFVDRGSTDARLVWLVALGTVPIGVAGVTLKRFVTGQARSLYVVAVALIVVGFVMWIADRRGKQTRLLADLRLADALLIGLGQACALVPGVSRSGATLTVALLVGLRRDDAARFSFLLSIPAIAAAGLFELKDAMATIGHDVVPLLVATGVAAFTGYASIAWLIRFLRTRSVAAFSVYRAVLGAALLAMLVTNVIRPF